MDGKLDEEKQEVKNWAAFMTETISAESWKMEDGTSYELV
jgi:hypothetical protein